MKILDMYLCIVQHSPSTRELNYVHFSLIMLFKFYLMAALAALAMAKPIMKRASKIEFFGVNESGPEFGSQNIPGVLGTDVR